MHPTYPGIYADANGGLTPWGQVVMDAWVLGLLPETEGCAGWDQGRLQGLYERVHRAWEPYGHLPSRLPPELQERHTRIYAEAVTRARAAGWQPEMGDD
jgi:hypothetical protein